MRIAIYSRDHSLAGRLDKDLTALTRVRTTRFDERDKVSAWIMSEKPAAALIVAGGGDAHIETLKVLRPVAERAGTALLSILNGDDAATPAAALAAGAQEICRRDAHPAELRNRISILLDLAEARAALWTERGDRQSQSIADGLTGLMNRRAFLSRLDGEIARARRGGDPLAVALIDVDRLQEINARHGVGTGDHVLNAVAGHTVRILREMDVAGRIGGTEFAVCLPQVGLSGGSAVLDRLRRRLSDLAFPLPRGSLSITVSVGITELDSEDRDSSDLINRADRALLKAKDRGRDRLERA